MNFINLFKNRIVQTVSVLFIFSICASSLSTEILQTLYTFSVLMKDLLMWGLPIMVCFFIAASLAKFEKQALLFVILLVTFEACSNFSSVWYAYGFGKGMWECFSNTNNIDQNIEGLKPFFTFSKFRPLWWSASKGTFIGLCLGLLCTQSRFSILREKIYKVKTLIEQILTQGFARLIPLFVLGFVANMYVMNIIENIFFKFIFIIMWILIATILYLFALYLVAAKFNVYKAIKSFVNLLPAGMIALTSGCSISTMPFTINGTSKNLKDPEFAQMVIPATTNIQQIGDCIINVLLCLVILKSFGHAFPDLFMWIKFSVIFTLARFATAAVLGGAIFIMLPVYKTYLGFSGEMIAIILAFNVLLDPIVTSSNVMANSALCNILENVWIKVKSFRKTLKLQVDNNV